MPAADPGLALSKPLAAELGEPGNEYGLGSVVRKSAHVEHFAALVGNHFPVWRQWLCIYRVALSNMAMGVSYCIIGSDHIPVHAESLIVDVLWSLDAFVQILCVLFLLRCDGNIVGGGASVVIVVALVVVVGRGADSIPALGGLYSQVYATSLDGLHCWWLSIHHMSTSRVFVNETGGASWLSSSSRE
ncbi:hypothetical protein K505DRAFT_338101 [Melanomma pulvis-pyrius CBS 109.77]|uniref:Uncharacterized protein n=1 Tax=Melanomma pulvis-pyrius CBS 109.77 TaxID=1314802 RepID=A0A6A6XAB9_9PLEO|nr:hypothetical protein K505DRAFT_338101 [Melanomma pulvis-pyrius CBS 109.77]